MFKIIVACMVLGFATGVVGELAGYDQTTVAVFSGIVIPVLVFGHEYMHRRQMARIFNNAWKRAANKAQSH